MAGSWLDRIEGTEFGLADADKSRQVVSGRRAVLPYEVDDDRSQTQLPTCSPV